MSIDKEVLRTQGYRRYIAIGVVVLVAIGATVGLGLTRASGSSSTSAGGSGYCADMDDGVGLYVGNPVTQMGFRIGRVSAVESAGGHVRVTFDLDGGRDYPQDVQAVTRSKSLLADRSLELVGNYESGPKLESGECIELANTFTPKSISEVAGSAADFIDNLTGADSDDVGAAIESLDSALEGTATDADRMFRQAAAASADPDRFITDIGASITHMAPLNESALRNWDAIMSILNQMPDVAAVGTELFYHVALFDRGVGWTVATLYDIQRNYGSELWPLMHGPVSDLISILGARAPDLAHLYEMVPSISAALREQQSSTGGLSVPYQGPGVEVDAAQCRVLGAMCETSGRSSSIDLLTLIVGKATP